MVLLLDEKEESEMESERERFNIFLLSRTPISLNECALIDTTNFNK